MHDLQAVLFDLDGTLLPLDFDEFLPRYLGRLRSWYLAAIGVDVTKPTLACAARIVQNDGRRSNAEVFWTALAAQLACDRVRLEQLYAEFIAHDGRLLADDLVPDRAARPVVEACRRMGLAIALATNPIFPRVMIDERLAWGNLAPDRFDLVTCSDRMRYCKPNVEYYRQVADELGVAPEACLMVGNDVEMDLVPAHRIGMRTCLVQNELVIPGDGQFTPDHVSTLADIPALVRRLHHPRRAEHPDVQPYRSST